MGLVATKGGPTADINGQVLDWEGRPITGLFAAGNVTASLIGAGILQREVYNTQIVSDSPKSRTYTARHVGSGSLHPFPGTAREALAFYGGVFGCQVQLHTLASFNRTDGPGDAIAHGYLVDGPVTLFAADASNGEPALQCEGLML